MAEIVSRRYIHIHDARIVAVYDLEHIIGQGHFAIMKLAQHVFTGEQLTLRCQHEDGLRPHRLGHPSATEKHFVVLLNQSTKAQIKAVMNDTVGQLAAAGYKYGPDCTIGVVIGYGCNSSYVEKTSRITKFDAEGVGYKHPNMVVVTEWEEFGSKVAFKIFTKQITLLKRKRACCARSAMFEAFATCKYRSSVRGHCY